MCAGRLLTGSGWTFNEIVSRFGGSAGTMYFCRERWDTANDPDVQRPAGQPGDHAQLLQHVLEQPRPGPGDRRHGRHGRRRLQPHPRAQHRQLAARPRRPGQRQRQRPQARHPADPVRRPLLEQRRRPRHRLVDGDAPVRHRPPRPRPPRPDDQRRQRQRVLLGARAGGRAEARHPGAVGPQRARGGRRCRGGTSCRPTRRVWRSRPGTTRRSSATGTATASRTRSSCGTSTPATGSLQNWTNGDSLNARIGTWARGYDEIIAGDWDGDGRVRRHDHLGPRHRQLRGPVVERLRAHVPRRRHVVARLRQDRSPATSTATAASNDMMLWDQSTGNWVVQRWQNFRWAYRAHGHVVARLRRGHRRRLECRRRHRRDDPVGPPDRPVGRCRAGPASGGATRRSGYWSSGDRHRRPRRLRHRRPGRRPVPLRRQQRDVGRVVVPPQRPVDPAAAGLARTATT